MEIYFDMAHKYAQKYMKTSKDMVIEDYQITKRDFLNNVISDKLFDYSLKSYSDILKMTDKEIASMFEYDKDKEKDQKKLFTDILFVDNKHNMIVKTW